MDRSCCVLPLVGWYGECWDGGALYICCLELSYGCEPTGYDCMLWMLAPGGVVAGVVGIERALLRPVSMDMEFVP